MKAATFLGVLHATTKLIMPAFRGTRKRPIVINGGPRKRRRTTPYTVAGRARLNVRVGGFIGIENKFFDVSKSATVLSGSGTILDDSLHHVPEGNGQSDRIGRKMTINSLFINAIARLPNATASTSSDTIRFIVYLDKQANGATATAALLMQDADLTGFRNLENSDRFMVLRDVRMDLNHKAGGGNGTTEDYAALNKQFQVKVPTMNTEIVFDNTATDGSMATIRSNNIGVLAFSQNGLATVEYRARIRYRG